MEDIISWKIVIPILTAIVAWFANELLKQANEAHKRKEEKYSKLICCLRGFTVDRDPEIAQKEKTEFIEELNQCWLYCPDDVIEKAYRFLDTVHDQNPNTTSNDKELALGDFILAVRKDLINRWPFGWFNKTKLRGSSYKLLKSN